jgi:DNA-binding XRE family transcriptional regulator
MKGLDPVLAQRIRELRASLNMSQGEFATRLGVIRTQVVEWEKGERERPSCEKILEMAELAPEREQRMWFLKWAGVNIGTLKMDICDENHETSKIPGATTFLEIPCFGEASIDNHGIVGGSPREFIPIPSSQIGHSEALFWVSSEHRPPWVENREEFVLVNGGMRSFKSLWMCLTAVFFSCFPVSDEILTNLVPFPLGWSQRPRSSYIDPDRSKSLREAEQALYRDREFGGELEKRTVYRIEDLLRQGILTGRLHIGYDLDGEFSDTSEEGEVGPWRLALEVRHPWSHFSPNIAISDWKFGRPPDPDTLTLQDFELKEGVHILGEVIGWFGSHSIDSQRHRTT